jgi:hypothetical protein
VGADTGTIAIIGISAIGTPTVLKTAETVEGAHCVTADDHDQVYVCDPTHGKQPLLHRLTLSLRLTSTVADSIISIINWNARLN